VDEDGESDPDNDADPGSPLLDSMLSDRQPRERYDGLHGHCRMRRTRDLRTNRGQLGKSIIELDDVFLTVSHC